METQPSAVADLDQSMGPGAGSGVNGFVVSAFGIHHAEIFTFLARVTRDRALAEGLLQDTFSRLAGEACASRPPVDVRAWLYRVASGLVIAGTRRQALAVQWLRRNSPTGDGRVGAGSLEGGAPRRELEGEMERVLDGLSLDARLGLLLSGAGFAGDEIAVAIDRTPAATRTLLGRARARVRVRRDLFAGEAH